LTVGVAAEAFRETDHPAGLGKAKIALVEVARLCLSRRAL
jgi:hypothetical protein